MSAGEVRVTDPASIAARGTYAASLSTRVASEYDAENLGLLMLARQAQPAWVLAGVAVDLELITKLPGITVEDDESMTAALLNLEVHDLVSVTAMPAGSPYTSALLWVEGWTETIAWGAWRIDLAVSDYCRTATLPIWDDVDGTLTWDTAPDVTWHEFGGCVVPDELPTGGWNDIPATTRWNQVDPTITWDTAEDLWPS